MSAPQGRDRRAGPPGDDRIVRLERELDAVNAERLRLRAELERIRRSPLGRLILPAETLRAAVARRLRPLARSRAPTVLNRGARSSGFAAAGRLSASELTALGRRRLLGREHRWEPAGRESPGDAWLTPILVDCFGRDGSTLTMALLSTSPEVAVEDRYPYERRYFTYLWRWAALLSQTEWPGYLWGKGDVVSIGQQRQSPLLGPPPWFPRELLDGGPGAAPISGRCFELAWRELSARALDRARAESEGTAPRYAAEKHAHSWQIDRRRLPPLELVVLLRDPRDTLRSIRAVEASDSASFALHEELGGRDRVEAVIDRQRRRLRWIAGLLDEGKVPVIRFEELSGDLGSVARRLERHLGIELELEALDTQRLAARHAAAGADGAGAGPRELEPAIAERMTTALRAELEAVGIEP